jgi:putative NADPH-quinone reductase
MGKRIVIIQGHPTAGGGRFCHALADAYAEGAAAAGHESRTITVTDLDFPMLRTQDDWLTGAPPPDIAAARADIAWCDHLMIVYPLWLGTMPALLKAFLEQAFRPGLAGTKPEDYTPWKRPLAGRSARIVVTMGMPAFVYRWYFGAHGLKSLEQNILAFVGIRPNRHSLIGMVEAMSDAKRKRWLERMRSLGRRAR